GETEGGRVGSPVSRARPGVRGNEHRFDPPIASVARRGFGLNRYERAVCAASTGPPSPFVDAGELTDSLTSALLARKQEDRSAVRHRRSSGLAPRQQFLNRWEAISATVCSC